MRFWQGITINNTNSQIKYYLIQYDLLALLNKYRYRNRHPELVSGSKAKCGLSFLRDPKDPGSSPG